MVHVRAVACLIVAAALDAGAQPDADLTGPPQRIVLLNAYHSGLRWTDDIVAGVEATVADTLTLIRALQPACQSVWIITDCTPTALANKRLADTALSAVAPHGA